jgi:hypothetical protein
MENALKYKKIIISDKKGMDDYFSGLAEYSSSWDAKPNYLLNKLLIAGNHEVVFIDHDEQDLETKIEQELSERTTLVWHIDKTFIPEKIAAIAEKYRQRGVPSLNARIVDISKRNVDRVCQNAGLPNI